MSTETVARRYSAALADVVALTGETETVLDELKGWETLIASNADLKNAFANPSIPHQKKEGVLEALITKTSANKTTANFLRVLLRNGRLGELDSINDRFIHELEDRSGLVHGYVSSAHELSDAERADLMSNLESVTGKKVRLDYSIDKDLIGGVVARVGSTVYDSSVRTKLEHLKEELMNR